MAYVSVDKLQNMLATEVFSYAKDKKKASGCALGTLVEIVTFYTLCAWELRDNIAIERCIPEVAHPEITHNVEFSLHPIVSTRSVAIKPVHLPITSAKVLRAAGDLDAAWVAGQCDRAARRVHTGQMSRYESAVATRYNSRIPHNTARRDQRLISRNPFAETWAADPKAGSLPST